MGRTREGSRGRAVGAVRGGGARGTAAEGTTTTLLGRYLEWKKRRAQQAAKVEQTSRGGGVGSYFAAAASTATSSSSSPSASSIRLPLFLKRLVWRIIEFVKQLRRRQLVHFAMWGGGVLCLYSLWRWYRAAFRKSCIPPHEEEEGIVDVCVVGAGPSGATCAYHLAKAGHSVILIDSQRFPHDKVCGDVVPPLAQKHLEEMGVLQQIVLEKEGRWGNSGGFVSPSGLSFIGKLTTGERLLSVQRIILDEKIAYAAESAGATLLDGFTVKSVKWNPEDELWTIVLDTMDTHGENYVYRARALVACDGAKSEIARQLGVINSPPNTFCCRSFAKAGTHAFPAADHVSFYSEQLLPGFFVVFHELEDFLNMCCYFIPLPSTSRWKGRTVEELQEAYSDYMETDPYIKQALGPDVAVTPCKFAPMRVGGVSRSYGNHFLVVGDAAGQVDPLTGGGIHFAMEAAKIAAETLVEAFREGDLTAGRLKVYQQRWRKAFGWDFWLSFLILRLLYRFPILLDAAAEVIKRKGDAFVGAWATAMMGGRSKIWFFYPTCAFPIALQAFVLLWRQLRYGKLTPPGT